MRKQKIGPQVLRDRPRLNSGVTPKVMKPMGQRNRLGEVTIVPRGLYIQTKITHEYGAKRAIAVHIATTYVKDLDAVLLDSGSTAELVAEEMFARRRFLSVLTNNMGAYASYTRARAVADDESSSSTGDWGGGARGSLNGNELLITGGRYVDIYESLLGGTTSDSIKHFTPNITIIGIGGLRCDEGVFCHGEEEAAVKQLIWTKPADVRLIAADWTKIGKRDAHVFGKLEEFVAQTKRAVVVTCDPPADVKGKQLEEFEEQIRLMKRAGIEVERLVVSRAPDDFHSPLKKRNMRNSRIDGNGK